MHHIFLQAYKFNIILYLHILNLKEIEYILYIYILVKNEEN